ncbi:hypothetical protein EDD17DRAFT_466183 [Pisolithus thermaeus]|nr:hypothetical protein EDD17DRAFT_466183 [Pisolithus thermaeus]
MLMDGFEVFDSLLFLGNGRSLHLAFHIPIVHLLATTSNNDPMSEFSLGSDTSLNALVDACDAIKQSASASRNRVLLRPRVENADTFRRWTGASLAYTSEQGMDPHMLRADVKFLKIRYGSDVKDKSGLFGARPSFLHLRTCTHVYLTRALTPYFHPESNVPLKCTPPMCSPIHSAKELAASSIRATPRLVT